MTEATPQHIAIPAGILERLRSAKSVAVLTGAGVSAESGIPTFRDKDGLWANFDPQKYASVEGWAANPQLMWGWYGVRRDAMRQARPNPAHIALCRLEDYYPDFTLVTQNIDNLHRLAGSTDVLELHGNIFHFRCSEEHTLIEDAPGLDAPVDAEAVARGEGQEVPRCPTCGALVRPDVVWFGESVEAAIYTRASAATKRCDVFFIIGTSSIVQPAALLPYLAQRHHALLVEINPEPTPLSALADLALRGPAGAILPPLVDLITATPTPSPTLP